MFRTASICLLAVGLTVCTANADLFTQAKQTPVGQTRAKTQTSTVDRHNGDYHKNGEILTQRQVEQIKSFVDEYKAKNPQYFRQASTCGCNNCKVNNVFFYFLEGNFDKSDIERAIQLAKEHGLNPVINIEVPEKLNSKQAYINAYYKIAGFLPQNIKHLSVEYDKGIVQKLKQQGNYFKFDSINGLKLGGKIEDFNRLYRVAFGD